MPRDALSCLLCNKELVNVEPGFDNQPYKGVCCFTTGNYGSTVFDPMNGERLEFNICDTCLVQAGEQGKIHSGRHQRPVVIEHWGMVGWEDVEYKPVPWHNGLAGYDDVCYLNEDDLRVGLPKTVHLRFTVEEILDMLSKVEEKQY